MALLIWRGLQLSRCTAGSCVTPRIVTPEILDGLPNDDPSAAKSRQDLRRVHRVMGTRGIVARALRSSQLFRRRSGARIKILEIGAGDGYFMLGVAGSLVDRWRDVDLTLLDRIDLVETSTMASYRTLGWRIASVVQDALAWAAEPCSLRKDRSSPTWDLIIANLFLHHFQGAQLAALLTAIETRGDYFFACEPHRSAMARAGSHFVGALGANAITRADAVSSVRAGFSRSELSAIWPGASQRWALREYAAGLFSHCFSAERITQSSTAKERHAASL